MSELPNVEYYAIILMISLFILPSLLLNLFSAPIFGSINASTATPNFGSIFNGTPGYSGTSTPSYSVSTSSIYYSSFSASCAPSANFTCQNLKMFFIPGEDINFEYGPTAFNLYNVGVTCVIGNNPTTSVSYSFITSHHYVETIGGPNGNITIQRDTLAGVGIPCYYENGTEIQQDTFPNSGKGEVWISYSTSNATGPNHLQILANLTISKGNPTSISTTSIAPQSSSGNNAINMSVGQNITSGPWKIQFQGAGGTGGQYIMPAFEVYYNNKLTNETVFCPPGGDGCGNPGEGTFSYNSSTLTIYLYATSPVNSTKKWALISIDSTS